MTVEIRPAKARPPTHLDRASRAHELFLQAAATKNKACRDARIEQAIVLHLDVAHSEAARYRSRGIPLDDLRQVAALALTKAAHGYDVTSGHEFLAYAVPTIRGELRKHFRDHGWMIRPPRRVQELQARINIADSELSARLGRSPVPREIAAHLEVDLDSVTEALASDGCFLPTSLDNPAGVEGSSTLADLLSDGDEDRDAAEARLLLQPLIRHLGLRDRRILLLRFFEGLTQREIAEHIGVTQMQVSRLLTRILGQLRSGLALGPEPGADQSVESAE